MRAKLKAAFERFLLGMITEEEFNRAIDEAWSDAYTAILDIGLRVRPLISKETMGEIFQEL